MSAKLKRVRFRSPPPSPSDDYPALSSVATQGRGDGTLDSRVPKPLPIPVPSPAELSTCQRQVARKEEKKRQAEEAKEAKKRRAEQRRAEGERLKADRHNVVEAGKSTYRREKERIRAESRARLKAIDNEEKQAKADAKAARKAEKAAAKAAKARTSRRRISKFLFGPCGSWATQCDCSRDCGCQCYRPQRRTETGETDYTYFPKYQQLRSTTEEYNAWKTGPEPILTQHLVYNPPRAAEAARMHAAVSGRDIAIHYPTLPDWKEYEGQTEPWRRYEGWNGYGWTGDRIGETKRGPDKAGKGGLSGPGKGQNAGKGQSRDTKTDQTPARTKPTPSEVTANPESPPGLPKTKPPEKVEDAAQAQSELSEAEKPTQTDAAKSPKPSNKAPKLKGILKASKVREAEGVV